MRQLQLRRQNFDQEEICLFVWLRYKSPHSYYVRLLKEPFSLGLDLLFRLLLLLREELLTDKGLIRGEIHHCDYVARPLSLLVDGSLVLNAVENGQGVFNHIEMLRARLLNQIEVPVLPQAE